jgi:hypothetical protein
MKYINPAKLALVVLVIFLFKTFGNAQNLTDQSQIKSTFSRIKPSKIGCTEINLIYPNDNFSETAKQIFPKYQSAIEYVQKITGEKKLKTTKIFLSPSEQITYGLFLEGNNQVITKPFTKSNLEKTVYFDVIVEMGDELMIRFTDSFFVQKGFSIFLAWKTAQNFANPNDFGKEDLLIGELLASSNIVTSKIKVLKENKEIDDSVKPLTLLKQLNLSLAIGKTSFYLFFNLMRKIESKSDKNEIKRLIEKIKEFNAVSGHLLTTNDFERIVKSEYKIGIFESESISKERVIQIFEYLLNDSANSENLRLVINFVEIPDNVGVMKKIIPFALQPTGNLPFAVALGKKKAKVEFNQAIDDFLSESGNSKYTKKQILQVIDNAVNLQKKIEAAN